MSVPANRFPLNEVKAVMKCVLPLFALAAIAPAQEIVISRQTSDALKSDTAYSRSSEVTFTGKVTGKLKSYNVSGRAVPVRIVVKSGKGALTNVDLGPTWFLKDQSTSINVGDRITVTGSKLKLNGQTYINARTVKKGRANLVLRDTTGFPYWVARRQETPVEPASGGISGRIARMTNITIGNETFNGVIVQTPDGERAIALAPDWYYGQQNINLAPGAYIRSYGGMYTGAFQMGQGVSSPAPGLYIANSLYTQGGFYGFTNPGGYVYGNFPGFPGIIR
ncbi:hypothetical protein EON81_07615 [bacterium]|nr:MAG: hypothetical protein EON81_07615 [bacterium]